MKFQIMAGILILAGSPLAASALAIGKNTPQGHPASETPELAAMERQEKRLQALEDRFNKLINQSDRTESQIAMMLAHIASAASAEMWEVHWLRGRSKCGPDDGLLAHYTFYLKSQKELIDLALKYSDSRDMRDLALRLRKEIDSSVEIFESLVKSIEKQPNRPRPEANEDLSKNPYYRMMTGADKKP